MAERIARDAAAAQGTGGLAQIEIPQRHRRSDHHFHRPAQGIGQSLLLFGGPAPIAVAYQWLMLVAP
jgi:hypothetical protein